MDDALDDYWRNVEATTSIMVGDRIDKEVIPAKMIGMKTIRMRAGIHLNQEPRTPDDRPYGEIWDLGELPEAVSLLRRNL